MATFFHRMPAAFMLLAVVFLLSGSGSSLGQEPVEGRFPTADGLKISYTWYEGKNGTNSDTVLLVHNYTSDSSKGPWSTLAKSLQKEGYAVLSFDFRGHGKSADFKVMDRPDEFVKFTFNRYCGKALNAKTIKDLNKAQFSPSYYPYLINDLTGARRFIDGKSDAGQCNGGRIFVVAEQSICPLVMLWITTEYARFACGPVARNDPPEFISAGRDICAAVFLSWSNSIAGAQALTVAQKVSADKEFGSETVLIGDQVRQKVAMAFIYGKEDKGSAAEAALWMSRFGVPVRNKADEILKYTREIAGAEKLSGIKLLDIGEAQKDKDEKVSVVDEKIRDFFVGMRKRDVNGTESKKRNPNNYDPIPVPLDMWGLRLPK